MSFESLLRPLGYQQIACDTAQTLTVPAGTSQIYAVAEGQAVRWRDDPTPPTTTVGYPEAVAAHFRIQSPATFKVIAQTAGGILNVAYYGAN